MGGDTSVSRVADLFALSPFPRFMDLTGHAADLWPVSFRIRNRLSPDTRIVDGFRMNQVRARVPKLFRFCALF